MLFKKEDDSQLFQKSTDKLHADYHVGTHLGWGFPEASQLMMNSSTPTTMMVFGGLMITGELLTEKNQNPN